MTPASLCHLLFATDTSTSKQSPCCGIDVSPSLPFCPFFTPQEFSSTKSITSRCDFLQNLIANGCAGAIENPSSSISVVKNVPLSSKGSGQTHLDVTQIMPQKVALNLRPGESPLAGSCMLGCVWGGVRKGGQDMQGECYSSWSCSPIKQVAPSTAREL